MGTLAEHTLTLLQGATPLVMAVCLRHKPLTELLLSEGACPSPMMYLVGQPSRMHNTRTYVCGCLMCLLLILLLDIVSYMYSVATYSGV